MTATIGVAEIARAVRAGETSARSVVAATLGRIEASNGRLNAFTDVLAERALARAEAIDAQVRDGKAPPLAGVPFAASNGFDLAGLATRAGSTIGRERPAAARDAALVGRLEAAGAVCVGAANMGEYGFDLTGGNAHDGPARNPHALEAMAGGAAGGAAAAVAAGLVPLSLGADGTGGLRVPAAFCGLFALRPTYGRLSRSGLFPTVPDFDQPGLLGRSADDVALGYDALQGFDTDDPALVRRPLEAVAGRLERGSAGLRLALADGMFAGDGEGRDAMEAVGKALGIAQRVTIAEAQAARAAAELIAMSAGAALHLERLRSRPQEFDPELGDRLLAGALLPAGWVERAQRFRRQFRDGLLALLGGLDAILVPAVPMRAPRLGQASGLFGGVDMPLNPNLGIFTQPFSLVGLPVAVAPIAMAGRLPFGVQVIAAPWREDLALRVARQLEKAGLARAPVARGFNDA